MADAAEMGQKPVNELAESGGGPPVRYIQREHLRPVGGDPPLVSLPIVDLSRLFQPGGDDDEAAKLRSALQSWGMFQAIGHDMSASFLDEVLNIARKFFQLPMAVKNKVSTRQGSEHVLRSMSKLLELDEDYLSNQFGDRAEVFARFNYYPCCSRPDLVFGIKPHSDGSAFTILLPDKDVEGLQVLKDGVWVKVPTIPHALLINMGDQMEIMSNGILKSPVHRVVTNPEKERISIAMFHAPEAEKELKPADGLVGERRPKLYKTTTTKEYLGAYFQHFVQGTRAIEEWAKT